MADYEITETTFKKMPVQEQNWLLFDTFNKYRDEQAKMCSGRASACQGKYIPRSEIVKSKKSFILSGAIGALIGMGIVKGGAIAAWIWVHVILV